MALRNFRRTCARHVWRKSDGDIASALTPVAPDDGVEAVAQACFVEVPAERDELSLSILPGHSRLCHNSDLPVLVTVNTPKGQARTPSDVCCVLDVSASMGEEARIMGSSGEAESHGLSLLDIAKHGVRTTINMLTESDRFALVLFNNEAQVLLELTSMTEEGKELAEEKLANVMASGGTNLWKGLKLGLEALRNDRSGQTLDSLAHLVLLTDGESMERDTIVSNLEAYKEQHERLPGTINTFGFGYCIDSRLLVNLANVGDGTYSFIPDAGFVGTAFVNTLSNLLVTFAHDVYVSLEPEGGSEIKEVLGNFQVERSSWGLRIRMGTLQHGQTRSIVVVLATGSKETYLTASAQYQQPGQEQTLNVPAVEGQRVFNEMEVDVHKCRYNFIDTLVSCIDAAVIKGVFGSSAPIRNKTEHNFGQGSSETSTEAGTASIASRTDSDASLATRVFLPSGTGRFPVPKVDTGGGVKTLDGLACQKAQKARRKAPALKFAKKMLSKLSGSGGQRKTTNPVLMVTFQLEDLTKVLESAREVVALLSGTIKDSMVAEDERVVSLLEDITGQATLALSKPDFYWKWGRHYLPSLMFAHQAEQCNNFKDPGVQRYGGALFSRLREQAEEIFDNLPAPQPSGNAWGAGPAGGVQAPISMAAYNDRYAGCIAGDCSARLATGQEIPVKELRKGQRVLGAKGEAVEIVCMVRMSCPGGRMRLVELQGGAKLTPHHPVLVEGRWVFPADLCEAKETACEAVYNFVLAGSPAAVVGGLPCIGLGHGVQEGAARHPYYSSGRAAEEVLSRPGAEVGLVDLSPEDILRDPNTGMVCGLRSP